MKRNMNPFKALLIADRKTKRGYSANAGYTLLEMIVVVAILAVGLTIGSMSINAIFSLEMKQCVKNISGELAKEKVASMTRTGEVYMRLYKNSDGVFIDRYENDTLVEAHIKVGTVKVAFEYYIGNNASGTALDENGIVIAFNKSNGSFKMVGQSRALLDDAFSPPNPDAYYSKLILSSGNISRTIVLWPNTGKFSISS